jgi:hypothetical protein
VNEAIPNLKRAMNNKSEDEFQQFANHIAAQLRQLLQNALLLQEKIRSLITKERISCMTLPSPLHVQIPQDVIYLSIYHRQHHRVINQILKTETFFRMNEC